MIYKINGKDVEMHLGIAFVAALDNKYKISRNNFEFGMGVMMALSYLEQMNPVILVDLIQAATITAKNKPTEAQIIEFIESEDIEVLCKDFLKELKEASTTKAMVKRLEREAQSAMRASANL